MNIRPSDDRVQPGVLVSNEKIRFARLKIWINLQGDTYDPESKMFKCVAYLGEDAVGSLADALSAVQGFEGVLVHGTKDAYDKRPKHIPRPVANVKEAFGAAKDLLRPRKWHWIPGTLK